MTLFQNRDYEVVLLASRQAQRSEETKAAIVAAAGRLFAAKGYETVTMREIAKEAGCSHTAIYIYFKDKEALLHGLSMPPLLALLARMEELIAGDTAPDARLRAISLAFVSFGLANRNMYAVFVNVKAGRVDEREPALELNRIRNRMFGLLSDAVRDCLSIAADDERALLGARIYFFALQGILATYAQSEESAEQLLGRLTPTFETTFDVVLSGLRSQVAGA